MKKHALPLSVSFPPPKKISAMESIVFLKERGLDAIDFAITNIIEERDDWRDDVPLIKAALEMTGLIAVSGHLPFRASDTMPLHDKILRGIEFAGEMGLKRAVLHPIGDRKADNTDESRKYWFEKNLEYYNTYIPYAKAVGLTLVTENMRDPLHAEGKHRYASCADEIIELADALELEICWDFGHANEAGLDQYSELIKLGSRLTMTHINDNWGTHDEHIPPFYGQGDWEGAMRGLREIGYRNPLNFELKFKQLPVEILPEAVSLTRSIGEYMLKNIVGE